MKPTENTEPHLVSVLCKNVNPQIQRKYSLVYFCYFETLGADVVWYEALVNIQDWFKLYIWQCAWPLTGKCLHRVSDHMTGSVGFDSSWESREEERQYTRSKHSHFHDRVRGSVTENYCIGFLKLLNICFLYIRQGYFGSVMGIGKLTGCAME